MLGKEIAKALMGPGGKEFDDALKGERMTKESSFLQKGSQRDFILVYFEAANVEKSFEIFASRRTRSSRLD